MRIIGTIAHEKMRISIFHMNQKYILKFELGNLEQAYKFSELDYAGLEDFQNSIESGNFITQVYEIFEKMRSIV